MTLRLYGPTIVIAGWLGASLVGLLALLGVEGEVGAAAVLLGVAALVTYLNASHEAFLNRADDLERQTLVARHRTH